MINKELFLHGYIDAAMWSSTNADGDPLDNGNYEIAPETLAAMREDCNDFIEANEADLDAYIEARAIRPDADDVAANMLGLPTAFTEYAGHDFWLTRNRHGAGFWDRGLGDLGDRLSEAAKVYGSVDLYVGDDFKVYA
jgi:hypothetical protein